MILCCHNPLHRIRERLPAIAAIGELREFYDLTLTACPSPGDYAAAVREAWSSPGPLVLIEHDMMAEHHHVKELLSCPEPLCAWVYWLSGVSTGCPGPVLAAQNYTPGKGYSWVEWGQEYSDHAGIGLCKIDERLRQDCLPDSVLWNEVCTNVSNTLSNHHTNGVRWHLHWPPVGHLHGFKASPALARGEAVAAGNA